ncbi:MAG: hypothetical protein V1791_08725 [Pseudomonadota bacterium]
MYSFPQGFPDPAILAIIAALITGCAGIPGLFLRTAGAGQVIAVGMQMLAALLGIPAALALLLARATLTYNQ